MDEDALFALIDEQAEVGEVEPPLLAQNTPPDEGVRKPKRARPAPKAKPALPIAEAPGKIDPQAMFHSLARLSLLHPGLKLVSLNVDMKTGIAECKFEVGNLDV